MCAPDGGRRLITVGAGEASAEGQDQAERYEAVQLPPDGRGRQPWAVWDRSTDLWVAASSTGELYLYFDRQSARGCIRSLRYLDQAGIRRT